MRRQIRGLRILITGASSGIGRALAERAAREGARLVLASRTGDRLEEVAGSLRAGGADVLAVPTDITCDEDRHRLMQRVDQQLGGLDVLVNNAGVGSFAHFDESSEDTLRQIMEVNFFAPAELTRLAIPMLIQSNCPAIVNVASMTGRRGVPGWSEYSASKHALCGLAEALRGELVRYDMDVMIVVPGLTRTDLPRHLLRNQGRMKINHGGGMPPETVANAILRALEKGKAEIVLGSEARWILRVNRLFPRFVDWVTARMVRKLWGTPGKRVPKPQATVPSNEN